MGQGKRGKVSSDNKITDTKVAAEAVTDRDWSQLIGTDFSDERTRPEDARDGYETVIREGTLRDDPLEICSCHQEEMTLVMLDLTLAGMNGWEPWRRSKRSGMTAL